MGSLDVAGPDGAAVADCVKGQACEVVLAGQEAQSIYYFQGGLINSTPLIRRVFAIDDADCFVGNTTHRLPRRPVC